MMRRRLPVFFQVIRLFVAFDDEIVRQAVRPVIRYCGFVTVSQAVLANLPLFYLNCTHYTYSW